MTCRHGADLVALVSAPRPGRIDVAGKRRSGNSLPRNSTPKNPLESTNVSSLRVGNPPMATNPRPKTRSTPGAARFRRFAMTNPPPRTQWLRTCKTCGARLERKRTGRPARYCSPRCRDKAYEGRTFSAFATSRIRNEGIRRNSIKKSDTSMACKGDSAGRGSGFSVPLDLIGHASLRFDSPRLEPTVLRTILENELPENKKPSGAGEQ
jgi:hypothetical protein